jgi:hypothetical protein
MAEERLKAAIVREEQDLAKSEERVAGSKNRSEKLHVRALQREIRMRIQALRYALGFVQGEKEEE